MRKYAGITMLLFGLLFLAACSAQATPTAVEPTQDLNPLRTEVAATVVAQVLQDLALTPSITPMPSPTLNPTATATVGVTETAASTPGTAVATLSSDKAKWISQTIQDGTRFAPGAPFTMVWRIQNVGQSTWTAAYRLRFYAGNAFGAPKEIQLDKEVAPNDTVDITIEMTAPKVAGEYRSDWVMSNEVLRNFNEPFYLKIMVATPTSTPTSTRTPVAPTLTPTK